MNDINPATGEACAFEREFSSADSALDLSGTRALLERYQLLVDQVEPLAGAELLR